MVAVAVIYGAFRLSGEIKDSAFDLIVDDPTFGTVYYCADEAQQPSNISLGVPCANPLQMTCQLGGTVKLAGETPLSTLAEMGTGGFEIPAGTPPNTTLLQALGFTSQTGM